MEIKIELTNEESIKEFGRLVKAMIEMAEKDLKELPLQIQMAKAAIDLTNMLNDLGGDIPAQLSKKFEQASGGRKMEAAHKSFQATIDNESKIREGLEETIKMWKNVEKQIKKQVIQKA